VAQIAFTQLNGFLLSTDGRLFSWGGVTHCLGRDLGSKTTKVPSTKANSNVGEIIFLEGAPIVKIATGRNHIMALDTKGRVYSWGKNEYG
jgi:alpha-tubulin suppressor-like RCC1 family protein